jgi:hypothetical protein
MTRKGRRIEPDTNSVSLHDLGDAAIGEPRVPQSLALRDRPENRSGGGADGSLIQALNDATGTAIAPRGRAITAPIAPPRRPRHPGRPARERPRGPAKLIVPHLSINPIGQLNVTRSFAALAGSAPFVPPVVVRTAALGPSSLARHICRKRALKHDPLTRYGSPLCDQPSATSAFRPPSRAAPASPQDPRGVIAKGGLPPGSPPPSGDPPPGRELLDQHAHATALAQVDERATGPQRGLVSLQSRTNP